MATIADLFSYIDSQKRRLSDTVQNPVLSLMQALGNANDQARTFNQAQQAAASEWQKTKQLNGPATQKVDRMMAESLAPAGMTVYHGSPYRFTAFDSKKIGTGEGAQAYGHGLYVAENPEVAKDYQKSLSDFDMKVNGKPYDNENVSHRVALIVNNAGSKEQAIKQRLSAYQDLSSRNTDWAQNLAKNTKEELDYLQSNKKIPSYEEVSKGNLYKIDIPDEHIDKMLDWDKPLSQQPENVKQAVKDHAVLSGYEHYTPESENAPVVLKQGISGDTLGRDVYKWFGKGDNVAASDMMKSYDVPGIKYFDRSSRNAPTTYHVGSPAKGFGDYTQFDNKLDALNQLSVLKNFGLHDAEIKEQVAPQTRNFVVFPGNEDILKIQDVNGNPIQQ